MRIHAAALFLLIVAVLAAAFIADAAAGKKNNAGGSKKDKEVIPKDKTKFTGDKNDPVIGIDLGTTYATRPSHNESV
jgi:hypothetical protein